MKNNPHITIEEVKRLNAERTQGEWCLDMHKGGIYRGDALLTHITVGHWVPNYKLMVASPAIATLCISQHQEIERLKLMLDATKLHAISMDCGRLCDNNKNIDYKEQWKRSEQYIEGLIKQALSNQDEGAR